MTLGVVLGCFYGTAVIALLWSTDLRLPIRPSQSTDHLLWLAGRSFGASDLQDFLEFYAVCCVAGILLCLIVGLFSKALSK